MVRQHYWALILVLGYTLLGAQTHALEVTASIDKNPVMLDEAFTLEVTATGDVDRNAFKNDALLSNFIVGNTSVSSQTQMINFSTTRSTTWRTTLFPRTQGTFTIPAFTIEGSSSQPISVRVIPTPTSTTQESRDFFVTTELTQNQVYVQQHVNYIVKLHMATNIERGSLQAPQMTGARIEQVGEDEQYNDIINGKRFQVIERTYVIVPEQSGEYVIQAPIFSGEILANNSRQSFSFFNRTQSVTRRGQQLSLRVNPIPSDASSHWLPSEFVELREAWSEGQDFIVGEPITRTLTLTVAGQTEEQLPEIEEYYPPSVKTYPDQANTVSTVRDKMMVAQRQESTAVIPTEAGNLVMPGVEVPWFNTRTQRMEVASVPARTVTILPASTESGTTAPTPQITPVAPSNEGDSAVTQTNETKSSWVWIAIASGFALLWLLTMVLWWRSKQTGGNAKRSRPSAPTAKQAGLKNLIAAIKKDDVSQTQAELLLWLREQMQREFSSLHEALAQPNVTEIKEYYQQMLASHYSASGTSENSWPQEKLINAIIKFDSAQVNTKKKSAKVLEPLYPRQS